MSRLLTKRFGVLVLLVGAGCARPPFQPARAVFVDLSVLERAHPAARLFDEAEQGGPANIGRSPIRFSFFSQAVARPLRLDSLDGNGTHPGVTLGLLEERLAAIQRELQANNLRMIARERKALQAELDSEVAKRRLQAEEALLRRVREERMLRDARETNLQLREIAFESQVRVLAGTALEEAEGALREVRAELARIQGARRNAMAAREASLRSRAFQELVDLRAEAEADLERGLDVRMNRLRQADNETLDGYRKELRGALVSTPPSRLRQSAPWPVTPVSGVGAPTRVDGAPDFSIVRHDDPHENRSWRLRQTVRFEVKQDAIHAARRLGLDLRFEPAQGRTDFTKEMTRLLYGAVPELLSGL